MREQVLEFIYRRFPDDCHWTDGNCYYFACILKARFEEGEIWYDAVDGHFVFKLEDLFFDWNGSYQKINNSGDDTQRKNIFCCKIIDGTIVRHTYKKLVKGSLMIH